MARQLVCGPNAVLAAIREHPERVESVWLASERGDERVQAVEEAARAQDVAVQRVARKELDRMANGVRHQGVIAQYRAPAGREQSVSELLESIQGAPLLLILDGVQDPHNLGACLRSADAAGAHAVIVPKDNTAPLSSVTRRAAAGAAETMNLITVTNLARYLRELKEGGVWIYGADQDAEQTLAEIDLTGPAAIVLGGEGAGLRRLTREHCDVLVRIPMSGKVGTLNLSVAAGICLYEAVRQRLSAG
ncbi:MAG: 23S rRNA (guanosine(2251)-2'-O)-methyltransferase RlmB [Pseudomonadota bacterium]|nr:MAG: 23S rRNA (guanosine(2251)-2'-O)-methyltransferase RlmB [Pseudomonadota bacterium]